MSQTLTHHGRKKKRVGRGGNRGRNSGRGHKGQRSRAGRRIRPALRDTLQRLPKRRGHNKNRSRGVRVRPVVRHVTLRALNTHFSANDVVSPKVLADRSMIALANGRVPRVKLVASGSLTIPLRVLRCATSASARRILEEAGGSVRV